MQLLDFHFALLAVAVHKGDVRTLCECSAVYAAYCDASCVGRVVKRCYEHLWRTLKMLGCRYMFQYGIEQGCQVGCLLAPVCAHPVVLCAAVENREIKLLLCCLEREHKVEYHLIYLLGTAVGLVHLVHYNYWLKSYLQCFLQHETCLRHGAFKSVDKQDAAVGHVEHALNLASEVAVTRSVNDVDFCILVLY